MRIDALLNLAAGECQFKFCETAEHNFRSGYLPFAFGVCGSGSYLVRNTIAEQAPTTTHFADSTDVD